jgi:hypothetical protein
VTCSRALLPLVAVALLAATGTRAQGADPTSTPTSTTPTSSEPPTAAPSKEPPEDAPSEDNWFDVGHSFIEQRVFAPILRLDRFFSDEREIEAERSRSFLRWRSEVRFGEDMGRPAFTTGLRATLRLPGLNKQLRRLRVVIAGETRDAIDTLFPGEPGEEGAAAETTAEDEGIGEGDAGLRFYLWDSFLSHASLGGGLLLDVPPGVYGRLRFRWAIPVRNILLTRVALVGFWRSDVKFGSSASLDLERPVVRSIFARLSGGATVSEGRWPIAGVEWSSELALLAPIPPRSAAQLGVAITGATRASVIAPDPGTGVARVWSVPELARTRAYARLRTDVYRRWLFIELEPEMAWPWTPERGRYAAWGLALRLEVQFQGKEAPPPRPPPAPPEPQDPPS